MAAPVAKPDIKKIARRAGKSEKEVQAFLRLVKRAMKPFSKLIRVMEGGELHYHMVERRGVGVLTTRYGKFYEYSFAIDDNWKEYSVIVKADVNLKSLMPVFKNKGHLILRTDSGCETGQVFGDETCDCCKQLQKAMKLINEEGEGIIVNIPQQDGRGMGLPFKLGTLWLQDALGVNTVESAGMLAPGGVIDIRTYSGVVAVLKFFRIPKSCKISLATNNPDKTSVFTENGYSVNGKISVVVPATKHTRRHFRAKEKHLGHTGLLGAKGGNK